MGPYNWRYYLSWHGRISRRDYIVGSQVIGLAGTVAVLVPFVLSMLWTPLATGGLLFVLFPVVAAALSIPGSSLLIRRAHDLGWPAALSTTALIVPLVFVLAMFVRFGTFGSDAAEAPWVYATTSSPLALVVFAFVSFLSLWLTFKKGQLEENRYGPAPV
jgi:uncharacterized membrane protein YhaH (DUF805 family)